METPAWALSAAYWLHMLATVVWIGGLAGLALFVLPAARKALPVQSYASFLSAIQTRFDPLAWFSLLMLAGTGMFQMSASPNYGGFLAINNRWAAAILIKHILFFGMTGVSTYLTWGLLPQLRRLALRQSRLGPEAVSSEETLRLQRQEQRLMLANLVLGVLVLGLTAIARAS